MDSLKEQLIYEYRRTNKINSAIENIRQAVENHKGIPGFTNDEARWLLENWEVLFHITKKRNKNARDFFVGVHQNQPNISVYDLKHTFKMSPGAVVVWKRFFVKYSLILETSPKIGHPSKKYLQINQSLRGISDIIMEVIASESKDSYLRKFRK